MSARIKQRSPSTTKQKSSLRILTVREVASAVKTMAAPSGTARYKAGKSLAFTAEKDPARVYPYFSEIAALLTSDSKIVRWNVMNILASLAGVDGEGKIDAIMDRYLAFIQGDNMISAANAIRGAGRIALIREDLQDHVLSQILKVERAEYETPECRNVAIGHALHVLNDLWSRVSNRRVVRDFIRRQEDNPRLPVARMAQRLSKRLVEVSRC